MSADNDKFAHGEGMVFNIQRYAIHDGPGIRTLVFLKGCPLSCLWCSNPESVNAWPELGFRCTFCNGCARCLEACPKQAITKDLKDNQRVVINHDQCDNCGACVRVCTTEALQLYGKKMTALQVFEEVRRDELFYRRSGGGVTLSGGEPLLQPRFTMALSQICRDAGIHVAIETSGYARSDIMETVLTCVDYVILDLKLMDESLHCKMVGRGNDVILRNARLIIHSRIPCQPRMPLVPSITDSLENIRATASFLKEVSLPKLELMPYHGFGIAKYESLGRQYTLASLRRPNIDELNKVRETFEGLGIDCRISL